MAVEVLVLSEDRGQGYETVVALLERVLTTRGPIGERQVAFIPAPDRMVSEAIHANKWKSSSRLDHHKKVSLVRTIATKVAQGTVVVFHYDGDTIWSERQRAETPRQFERAIRTGVRQLLSRNQAVAVEAQLARLIEVTPHYSIEAWTYQADQQAIEICRAKYACRNVTTFEEWARDRSLLDEVDKPKERTCLTNQHNEALARKIPCRDVVAEGKSFAEFLKRLGQCGEIAELIRPHLCEAPHPC